MEAFLTHLSVAKDASPNTQKLALNALMFLYNRFLNSPIGQLNFKYAKKLIRTPTVFTHEEAMSVIDSMVMPYKLLAHVKQAIKKVRIHKHASCHTFRHSFATRLLQAKYDLKQIQTLMGHTDIRTTEIYLHVLDELGDRVKSPLDV
ncbi:MAG TPA: tyrosine-type recombinase/integrase [Cellvibrio sp.]|nr:tyrosine-type recombinase/integrase [Cellvibrio sp.]